MSTPASIEVSHLSYRYPSGQQALHDITLTIQPGETIGLVGPSGAGKSTLLLHLNGLLPNSLTANGQGESPVRIGSHPLTERHLYTIRRLIGFVFQDPDDQLFCPTVEEDVAFGPLNLGLSQAEVRQRITESLERVGLSGFEKRSTLELSLGERKRVSLAGVLAYSPEILLLDEPFSNLDPRARQQLLGILQEFEGIQIIATHELDLVVQHCSRVILIDKGTLHADGSPRDVLSRPALMEKHGLEVPLRLQRNWHEE